VRTLIPALLRCAILALLAQPVQRWVAKPIRRGRRRENIFIAPVALSALFWLVLLGYGIRSPALVLLIFAYTLAPAVLAYAQRAKPVTWSDFGIIILLWLPLEFTVGAQFIPTASARKRKEKSG
jgi:hypothetical protein